jgi:hypothetical protein
MQPSMPFEERAVAGAYPMCQRSLYGPWRLVTATAAS